MLATLGFGCSPNKRERNGHAEPIPAWLLDTFQKPIQDTEKPNQEEIIKFPTVGSRHLNYESDFGPPPPFPAITGFTRADTLGLRWNGEVRKICQVSYRFDNLGRLNSYSLTDSLVASNYSVYDETGDKIRQYKYSSDVNAHFDADTFTDFTNFSNLPQTRIFRWSGNNIVAITGYQAENEKALYTNKYKYDLNNNLIFAFILDKTGQDIKDSIFYFNYIKGRPKMAIKYHTEFYTDPVPKHDTITEFYTYDAGNNLVQILTRLNHLKPYISYKAKFTNLKSNFLSYGMGDNNPTPGNRDQNPNHPLAIYYYKANSPDLAEKCYTSYIPRLYRVSFFEDYIQDDKGNVKEWTNKNFGFWCK